MSCGKLGCNFIRSIKCFLTFSYKSSYAANNFTENFLKVSLILETLRLPLTNLKDEFIFVLSLFESTQCHNLHSTIIFVFILKEKFQKIILSNQHLACMRQTFLAAEVSRS